MTRVFQGLVFIGVLNIASNVWVIPPVVDGLHHSDDFLKFGIWTDFAFGDANVLSFFTHIDYQTDDMAMKHRGDSHRNHLAESNVYERIEHFISVRNQNK